MRYQQRRMFRFKPGSLVTIDQGAGVWSASDGEDYLFHISSSMPKLYIVVATTASPKLPNHHLAGLGWVFSSSLTQI